MKVIGIIGTAGGEFSQLGSIQKFKTHLSAAIDLLPHFYTRARDFVGIS